LKLFDFFLSKLGVLVLLFGMTIFSALKFNPPLSFPRFTAGGLGDFNDLGEIGGGGGGGGEDVGATFFSELRRSRLGTRLEVGWRTGLPLIRATVGVGTTSMPMVTVALEHILCGHREVGKYVEFNLQEDFSEMAQRWKEGNEGGDEVCGVL
jgi:hypothetical protein